MTRAIIKRGEQARFLKAVKKQLDMTWKELAKVCGVTDSALYGWASEKMNMSYEAMMRLHELSAVSLPTVIEVISKEKRLRRAGRKGGKGFRKEILIPQRSPKLAEFVGILLGDGGMDDEEVYVDLHRIDEAEYAEFVAQLYAELFGLAVSTSRWGNSCRVRVHSVALIEYLESIGLQRGDKVAHQVGVPSWIFLRRNYMEACTRGLMDTDGGPCRRTQRRVHTMTRYMKIAFSNHSKSLVEGMYKMLTELSYRPRKGADYVVLNRREEIRRYYAEIGTSNAYHLKRYLQLAREAWGQDLAGEIKWLG